MGKYFHLGDVLTVTADMMLSRRGFVGLSEIVVYMTGEKGIYNFQLADATDICRPHILKQYPELANADCTGINEENYEARMSALVEKYGAMLEIEPLPLGVYQQPNPVIEFAEKFKEAHKNE